MVSVRVRQYALIYDNAWAVDARAVEAAMTSRTRALILVNPNNPTGSYVKAGELTALTRLCRDLLTHDAAACAAERERVGALLVDEFQDTSGAQIAIFEKLAGDRPVIVVGDRKQSIYDFRGADVAGAQAYAGRLLARGAERFVLRESRRSRPALVELASRKVSQTLQALEESARRVADREQKARDPEARGEKSLLHRNLSSLTADEVQRMRAVVRRLAERLKARLSRRRKVRRRGHLSVRRTLRKNLSTGGEPYKLVFRARRPERPEIVVLCDVSDSVRNVSRLMLQFVYTLQELYARVRSFVFVSEIGEVTHLFKKMDVSAAVDLATAGRVINVAANSNYGHALKMFHTTWLGSVTRRSTVIVIGDGRTNYNPANAWVLGEVKRKARRVIWLCPEDPGSWGFGDSEMPLYSRHCTRVEVVKSVDDLGRVAAELMP